MKNKKRCFKIFLFLIISFFCAFLFKSNALAEGLKLGIYPPIIQVEAIPPTKIETGLTIINFEEKEINLEIIFKPFIASISENGEVEYVSLRDFFKEDPLLFQKIKIYDKEKEINKLILGPKQKRDLKIIFDIPNKQNISDYYFSIIFVSTNAIDSKNTQSFSLGGIASNILLSIGPKDIAKGNIEEFSVPWFIENGPVPFTVRIKNNGNQFFTPSGEIIIKNLFGKAIGRVDLLPVNILAQSIRAIPDSLQSPEATKSTSIKALENQTKPTAYWNEKFLLGPHSATLTIALSENGPLYKKTVYFFAFPLKIVLGFIVAIFVIVFIQRRIKNIDKIS